MLNSIALMIIDYVLNIAEYNGNYTIDKHNNCVEFSTNNYTIVVTLVTHTYSQHICVDIYDLVINDIYDNLSKVYNITDIKKCKKYIKSLLYNIVLYNSFN